LPVAGFEGGPNLGFGNAGKDAVVGPGRTNFTTALYKSFAFGERSHFELRADSFNTFNHTQFNSINNGLNFTLNPGGTAYNPADYSAASNFGFVNGTQDPREFEIGGKLVF
jgi:hypothetical protein